MVLLDYPCATVVLPLFCWCFEGSANLACLPFGLGRGALRGRDEGAGLDGFAFPAVYLLLRVDEDAPAGPGHAVPLTMRPKVQLGEVGLPAVRSGQQAEEGEVAAVRLARFAWRGAEDHRVPGGEYGHTELEGRVAARVGNSELANRVRLEFWARGGRSQRGQADLGARFIQLQVKQLPGERIGLAIAATGADLLGAHGPESALLIRQLVPTRRHLAESFPIAALGGGSPSEMTGAPALMGAEPVPAGDDVPAGAALRAIKCLRSVMPFRLRLSLRRAFWPWLRPLTSLLSGCRINTTYTIKTVPEQHNYD